MFGTLWISWSLFSFRKTPFLSKRVRELLCDYSATIGVVIMGFVGAFVFRGIKRKFLYFHDETDQNIPCASSQSVKWVDPRVWKYDVLLDQGLASETQVPVDWRPI